MRILSLSYSDAGGGAERVALDLHRRYLEAGHDARLVVKHRRTSSAAVFEMPRFPSSATGRMLSFLSSGVMRAGRFRGQPRVVNALAALAHPRRIKDFLGGSDNYFNPECARPDFLGGWMPDVVHGHNLHGGYFDLEALVAWSRRVPVVLTAHDTWLITGHCGYFVDCDRWRTGCGQCPDLRRSPAIVFDGTANNFRLKEAVFRASENLHIVTPSRWLLERFANRGLAAKSALQIPTGIDLKSFHPGNEARMLLRRRLGLSAEGCVVLGSAATLSLGNPYKDAATLLGAARLTRERFPGRFQWVLLGGSGHLAGADGIHLPGYVGDQSTLADYYRASDVFVHAAHSEVLGCTLLEAQACGTPVVATDVGGVTETFLPGRTGLAVARGDASGIADSLMNLTSRQDYDAWRHRAARHAHEKFDASRQVRDYLEMFDRLRAESRAGSGVA
jgi:glycosyltransferase involved in cell wall biosynthesis